MKVSREKKAETRRDLIHTAVELFTHKGVAQTTMREISTQAGYAPATVYNYFPTKEKIFYAYFDLKQDEAGAALDAIPEFGEYTLKEKLQAQLEAVLETYTPDREFVAVAYRALIDSPMRTFGELRPVRQKQAALIERFLGEARERGEIPASRFDGFLATLYWEFSSLVVLYWLRDDSDLFHRTTELVDLSLDLYVQVIQSGVIGKGADLLTFLLKSHCYGNFDRLARLGSLLGKLHELGQASEDGTLS